ncbi:hypothetical protein ACR579_001314 [Escherichia coli]|uniref:Uncharacterized protein n=1 Tax=Escherichia marmotae TaxID=1499973 RepID=A0A7H9K7C3_9ESCH|nr:MULTISPECIES: hypothetical protein [Escherichia]EES0499042.1 hypothetical protein [Escherichia coli]EFB9303476.1 hypothetical protein [Escherichia coli]EFC1637594.1 hypothetical protein [Escherichia coli]EFH9182456.1 hypothetical protein [Escherichia coli]EFN5837412.1 hypothetical protein [Escherichia coli]
MSIGMSQNFINWMNKKLCTKHSVDNVIEHDNQTLTVTTRNGEIYLVGAVNAGRIELSDLNEYLNDKELNILIIQGDLLFMSGDAIELLRSKGIAYDSFGRFSTGLDLENISEHLDKENKFIIRGLRQHSDVSSVERLTNKKYMVERCSGPSLIILSVNDYDLSAEAVRTACQIHGGCDIILSSNPYSRITHEATIAARSMNIEIFKWGDLLSRISK